MRDDEVVLRAERLGRWEHAETPAHQRVEPRFEVKWHRAIGDLAREVRLIGGRELVLELDCRPRAIGKGGWLLDNDGVDLATEFPGVRVTVPSRHGTLVYACDNYRNPAWLGGRYLRGWQANVRAITLTLEALRAIDRYGAARHGEQYAGFRALPPGSPIAMPSQQTPFPTADAAARWLSEQARVVGSRVDPSNLLDDPEALRSTYRQLAKLAHPDAGGDAGQYQRLVAARETVERSHTGA